MFTVNKFQRISCKHVELAIALLIVLFSVTIFCGCKTKSRTVYIIDDFYSDEEKSHGEIVKDIVCCGVSRSKYLVQCFNIDLGERDSVVQLNETLKKILETTDADSLINMSFGQKDCNKETYMLIEMLQEKRVVIVAAAGNDGENRCDFPAGYSLNNIFAVGAVKTNGQIAEYSNCGDDVDVYVCVADDNESLGGTSEACARMTNMLLLSDCEFSPQDIEGLIKKCGIRRIKNNGTYIYIRTEKDEK
jgi:hypothetical protein